MPYLPTYLIFPDLLSFTVISTDNEALHYIIFFILSSFPLLVTFNKPQEPHNNVSIFSTFWNPPPHLRFTDMRYIKTMNFVNSPFRTNSMKVAVLLTNHGDTQTPKSIITTAINCDRN
jgi:hypothetical protein